MENRLKKLPIGIQTFSEINNGEYVYVDKTERIFQLVDGGKYYFLARPRRFGKSLLVSTLEAYFQGRKDLFKGLKLEQLEKDWKEYPVLRLDLSGENYSSLQVLNNKLDYYLDQWAKQYDIHLEIRELGVRFGALIKEISNKTGKHVVLLIDEYDKPLIDTIAKHELFSQFREVLHGFYSNIKASDAYIRFALLTGVSHFSKLSIFSGLNNLTDISLSTDYYDICGVSESELRPFFKPYIEELAQKNNLSYEDCTKKLKEYYDGYHFAENTEGIYNPFSLLNAFLAKKFGTYWVNTGTPTFLVECLQKNTYSLKNLTGTGINEQKLTDIHPYDNDPRPLFYQTGYLTIKTYDNEFREYTLDYPNREVEESFMNFIIPYYINTKSVETDTFSVVDFTKDIIKGDVEAFMQKLKIFFAGIPYDITIETAYRYENYYQTILYIIFKLIGFHIHAEYKTSNGRIDLLLQTKTTTYIIELKANGTAKEALEQINNKQYTLPFELNGTQLVKIGVAFNKDKRLLEDWVVEQ
jgi:hypothetical protein